MSCTAESKVQSSSSFGQNAFTALQLSCGMQSMPKEGRETFASFTICTLLIQWKQRCVTLVGHFTFVSPACSIPGCPLA